MNRIAPLLSIVIVNWNSWAHIHRCLKSIQHHGGNLPLEIIVVDNNSSDDSVKNLKHSYPNVRLAVLNDNRGFPKATNMGFEMASGDYLLALNPDTMVYGGTLQRSIEFLKQNKEYGCVGVKTLKPNGRIQYECAGRFLTLQGALWETLLLDKLLPRVSLFSPPAMTDWDHEDERDVDRVQGAFMMISRSVYEAVGGLDETLPMFLEDQEFCIRLWNRGYKIRYLTDVYITHFVGRSTKKAAPGWIAFMRYESYHRVLRLLYGKTVSELYPVFLLLILPIKIALSPFLASGIYIKNRYNRLRPLFYESIHGLKWIYLKWTGKSRL